MKLLIAILALVALCSALDSSLKVQNLWNAGAKTVAPPVTEPDVDGEELKNSILASYTKYLSEVTSEVENQIFNSVNGYTQESDARNRDIVNSMQSVYAGVAKPDEFDSSLYYLANLYNAVSYLVLNGYATVTPAKAMSLQDKSNAYAQGSLRYELGDFFYGFEETVLRGDFAKVQVWLEKTWVAGENNVLGSGADIEKGYRDDYLWPMVKHLQKDAKSNEAYDSYIEDYSTATLYTQFVGARERLLELPLDF